MVAKSVITLRQTVLKTIKGTQDCHKSFVKINSTTGKGHVWKVRIINCAKMWPLVWDNIDDKPFFKCNFTIFISKWKRSSSKTLWLVNMSSAGIWIVPLIFPLTGLRKFCAKIRKCNMYLTKNWLESKKCHEDYNNGRALHWLLCLATF